MWKERGELGKLFVVFSLSYKNGFLVMLHLSYGFCEFALEIVLYWPIHILLEIGGVL